MAEVRNRICAATALAALLAAPTVVLATPSDATLATLAAEAEKSGAVIWYESSPDDQAAKIAAAFNQRFPKVTIEHIRDAGGNSIAARIVQESQAGTRTADIATSGASLLTPLVERNLVEKIDWAGLGIGPEVAHNDYGVLTTAVLTVIVYNTALVPAGDAPKNWEDLLDPRWDGKIGLWVRAEGQGSLAEKWGEAKVADYITRLKALHPVFEKSTFPMAQQVAAGETQVALGLYHSAQPALRKGAPIKVVVPDPAAINALYSFVPAKGGNRKGGQLLALWLATPEGAKAYEDATDRGNPAIAGTRTQEMLRNHTIAVFPIAESAREAEIIEKFNRLIADGGKPK
ncbi:MAG: transporter substrate-binding protein [Rhodospirillales bacterium]|nr:transporter substrate-binding protein [Rhodospirillales bacterium]